MVLGIQNCKPNEALVISGCCRSSPTTFVAQGWKFTFPCVQRVQRISLSVMKITVESPRIYAPPGVTISVIGVSEVKISSRNRDILEVACKNFLGKSEQQIRQIVKEVLENHQSAIIQQMTVEEIYTDRRKFCTAFFESASADLEQFGISVLSYRLENVSDEDGYLKALGEARRAILPQ